MPDAYRLTSSALCAIKKPWVFAWILAPRGLIDILQSAPSSVALISIASRSSFNFVKHNLNAEWKRELGGETCQKCLVLANFVKGFLSIKTRHYYMYSIWLRTEINCWRIWYIYIYIWWLSKPKAMVHDYVINIVLNNFINGIDRWLCLLVLVFSGRKTHIQNFASLSIYSIKSCALRRQ